MRVKLAAKWQMESSARQLLPFKAASRVRQCKWRYCACRVASLQLIYERLNAPLPFLRWPHLQCHWLQHHFAGDINGDNLRQGLCDNCQHFIALHPNWHISALSLYVFLLLHFFDRTKRKNIGRTTIFKLLKNSYLWISATLISKFYPFAC